MPRLTNNTITEPDVYLADLERVQQRAYAFDDREDEVDGRCVAVSIGLNRVPEAISLSAPASRLSLSQIGEVAASLVEPGSGLAAPHIDPGVNHDGFIGALVKGIEIHCARCCCGRRFEDHVMGLFWMSRAVPASP